MEIDSNHPLKIRIGIVLSACLLLSVTVRAQTTQGVLTQDYNALVDLYNSTTGGSWSDDTNWATVLDVVDWSGVTVTADRVTGLDLSANNLAGTLPASLGDLTGLVTLNLSDNSLTGSIPTEVGSLVNLTTLLLSNNSLSGSIPLEITNLSELSTLNLHNNMLTGSIPTDIGDLSFLQVLDLSINQLSGSIPPSIGSLTDLIDLSLYSNQLTGSVPMELGTLSALNFLYLNDNQLSDSIPEEIGNLITLQNLSLNQNQLIGSIPAELANLTALTGLYLQDNFLSSPFPAELGELVNLVNFDISQNNISGDVPAEFQGLVSLESLNLAGNDVSSLPNFTGDWTLLQTLVVDQNRLQFGDLEPYLGVLNFTYADQQKIGDVYPTDFFLKSGENFALSFPVSGSGNAYRWFKDGVEINGETTDAYSIPSFSSLDSGAYELEITNTLLPTLTLLSNTKKILPLSEEYFLLDRENVLFDDIASGAIYAQAWADIDLDGDDDFFVGVYNVGVAEPNRLYENNGDGTFTLISAGDLTSAVSDARSAAWGDFNNDGYPDIFVGDVGYRTGAPIPAPVRIYKNNGDKTFTALTLPAVTNLDNSEMGAWGDYDQDGFIDLAITGSANANTPFVLYRNNGNETFTTVENALKGTDASFGTVTWVDADDNGTLDLFFSSATKRSYFKNNGNGSFTKDSTNAIVTEPIASSRGHSWADFDNDGDQDLVIFGQFRQKTKFFRNDGAGNFTVRDDLEAAGHQIGASGSAIGDIDNDGDLDFFVLNNGIKSPLFLNDGTGKFTRVTPDAQSFFAFNALGTTTLTDFTNDGYLDLTTTVTEVNQVEENFLRGYVNTATSSNNWVKVKLVGNQWNKMGLGAKLVVNTTGGSQYRQVGTQSGFGVQNSLIQHFGLGSAGSISSITVEWAPGKIDIINNPSINTVITLREGEFEGPVAMSAVTLSESSLRVGWDINVPVANELVVIERADVIEGPFTPVDTLDASMKVFEDSALQPNKLYFYRAKRLQGALFSGYGTVTFASTFTPGLPDTWKMLNTFITQGRLTLVDVEIDTQGNTYLVGNYLGVINIDGVSFTATGSNDAIVIRVNAQDDIAWVKSFGGLQADIATSITLSPADQLFLAGYYNDSFAVDGISVTKLNPGVSDAFVARVNSSTGVFEWITTTGATGGTAFNDVALDTDGNLYLPGYFNGDLTFGASTMLGGGPGLFKVAADGTKIFGRWGVLVGPTRFVNGFNAVRVAGNNVFVAGEVDGDWSFGGISTTKNALRDGVLVSYSLSGDVQWLKTLAGPGEDFASEITVDNAGNVFWVGDFNGASTTVSGTKLNNQGTGYELSIIKVNGADGTIFWGASAGTANESDIPYSVATDGTNLFVAGTMGYGITTFGSQTLDNGRLFLASYDGGGNVRWVDKSEGTLGLPWGMTFSFQKSGILMTGSFEFAQRFGTIDLASQGTSNSFLAFHNDSDAPIPPSPLNFEAFAEHGGSITLAWNQTPGAATFSIEKSGDKDGPFVSIASVADSVRVYTDSQIDLGQTYYYRMRSQANGLFSEYTNTQGVYSFSGRLTDSWDNVRFFKGKGRQNFLDASTDAEGNTYLVGYTSDTIVINGQTLLSKGDFDLLIVKLDAIGNLLWGNTYGSTALDLLEGVKADSNGNVYAVGSYNGAIDIGGISLPDPGHSEFVTIKLNAATGAVVWAKPSGASGSSGGLSVDVGAAGNVYSSGYFGGNLTHGSTSVTGGGHILLKYSADGTALSAIAGTLLSSQAEPVNNFQRVKVNGSGVFVIGNYNNDWSLGGLQATGAGARDVLVAKYNVEGVVQWLTTVKGAQSEEGRDLFVDSNGDTYLLAYATSTEITVDTLVVNTQGKTNLVAKLSGTNGKVIWAKTFGSVAGGDFPFRIVGSNSGFFVVGTMGIESTDFGNGVTAEGGVLYLASFDGNGLARWVDKAEGPAYGWTLTYSGFHNAAVVAGGVHHKVQMGTDQFTGETERDLFFATHADSEALAGVPQITKAVAVNTNTAYLKWLPVTNAKYYLVEGKLQGDSTGFQGRLVPSDTTELVFGEALLADSTYQFRVVAFGNSTSQQAASPAINLTLNCEATPISSGDYKVVISGTKRDGELVLQDESFANIYAVDPTAYLINGITGDYYQKYFGGGILTDTLARQCNYLSNQTLTDPTGISATVEAFAYSTDTLWMDYNTVAGDWLRVRFYKTTDQIDSSDLATIVKLYDTTGGDLWTNKTNWKSSLPVGLWHGIETANGRVVRINLLANNLVGNLPPELFAMDSLRSLNLSQNQLTGSLPATISGLSQLQSFLLADNRLSGEIPTDIGKLTSVTSFDLGRNLLVGSLPASIGNLVNLESLFGVMGNKLEGAIPPAIGNLNKLRVLAFDANQFEGKIPQEIGRMAALEQLYLHKNKLSGALPDSLVRLKNLRVVYLSENELEGAVPAAISSLDSLDQFIVHTNKFSLLPLLTTLSSLDSVNVANNKLGFGSIEPNLGVNRFVYNPQGRFGFPVDTLHNAGEEFTFVLTMGGTANGYQWFRNDLPLSEANAKELTIAEVGEEDEGSYFARVVNTNVTGLTIDTEVYQLKISSFKRDSLALVAIYNATGGPAWVNKTNWTTGNLSTWSGVTLAEGRVAELILPDNRMIGALPPEISDLASLIFVNFSNSAEDFDSAVDNQISFVPDLGRLTLLTEAEFTRNRLGFASIEPNFKSLGPKFKFNPQRRFGETTVDSVPVGQSHRLAIDVSGENNSYQWYFNDQPISGSNQRFHIIETVNYEQMGYYFAEVRSSLVPDFFIRNRNQNVLATADLGGVISFAADQSLLNAGKVSIYQIKSGPYDSLATVQVSSGAYLARELALGDYVLLARPDLLTYPDALLTYYSSTIDWVQADTLRLRGNQASADISLLSIPPPLNGDGVIKGELESDIPDEEDVDEESRILNRERVNGAGVTMSRQRFRGKGSDDGFDYEFVAYAITDENGSFSFDNLPDATYQINIQYPGVPMDQSSDLLLTLGEETDQDEIRVAALVTPSGIVVDQVEVKGIPAPYLKDINVYPNPSEDALQLDYFVRRKIDGLSLRLTDVTGRQLMMKDLPFLPGPQNTALDISGLTSGMYVLILSDKQGIFTQSIRVQKK